MTDENKEMRERSGHVTSDDPLVSFLYLLARDKLPVGSIERLLQEVAQDNAKTITYTNGWLAAWAQNAAQRLQAPHSTVERLMDSIPHTEAAEIKKGL